MNDENACGTMNFKKNNLRNSHETTYKLFPDYGWSGDKLTRCRSQVWSKNVHAGAGQCGSYYRSAAGLAGRRVIMREATCVGIVSLTRVACMCC